MKAGHGKKEVNIRQLFQAFLPEGLNKRLREEPVEPFPTSHLFRKLKLSTRCENDVRRHVRSTVLRQHRRNGREVFHTLLCRMEHAHEWVYERRRRAHAPIPKVSGCRTQMRAIEDYSNSWSLESEIRVSMELNSRSLISRIGFPLPSG